MPDTTTPDVVDILTTDHHEVLDLLTQLRSTTDPAARRDTADTIIAEIVRHSVAEEMFVYPAMREHLADGERTVQHDVQEHQELEETMKRLEHTESDSAEFEDVVASLQEQLRHHAEDEEREQFPQLRREIPADQLVELGHKVEAAKKAAPTRPHPGAPHSALFHKTLGPGVGLLDRMRDALTGRSNSA